METSIGKKVEQLLNSDEFAATVQNCGSLEDIRQAFAKEGVQLNDDQFSMLMGVLKEAAMSPPEGELSEAELNDVAGGVSVKDTLKWMIKGFKWGWNLGNRFYEWEQSLYR